MGKSYSRPVEVQNSAVINTVSFNPSAIVKTMIVTIIMLALAAMSYFTARYFGLCRRAPMDHARERFTRGGSFRGGSFRSRIFPIYPSVPAQEATTSQARATNNYSGGV